MAWLPAAHAQLVNLNEGFNDITTLAGNGWSLQNHSSPVGSLGWFQGIATNATPNPGPFDAYQGAPNAYIAANFNNTGSIGTISNWLLTPELRFGMGASLTFWTRKPTIGAGQTDYPDRLQVRLSASGASTNVGTSATDVGDFGSVLLEVNPTLTTGVYPQVWTQYTVSGLPANGSGRIAFRYFVTGAGSSGTNSDYIGIDEVAYTGGTPGYTVGGTVTGLAGSGLVLHNNGGDSLVVNANGNFTFATPLATGANYAVTVATQPGNPAQTCSVTNATGMIGTANVTNVALTCVTLQPQLTLVLDDGRDHLQYGKATDYTVTLSNQGNATASGVHITGVLSSAFDAPNASWQCLGAGNGAVCAASGNGPLDDATVVLPAGRSLTFMVHATVRAAATEDHADFTVNVPGATPPSATDSNTLVIFRDGFDNAPALIALDGATAEAILSGNTTKAFTLPSGSANGIDSVISLHGATEAATVQVLTLGQERWIRLSLRAGHEEQVSGWMAVADDATLALASMADAGRRTLLLEGASAPLSIPALGSR